MDIDALDADLMFSRGLYATVNGEYKTAMSELQSFTQGACDSMRFALQNESSRRRHLEDAHKSLAAISALIDQIDELKAQKDELYQAAWGK